MICGRRVPVTIILCCALLACKKDSSQSSGDPKTTVADPAAKRIDVNDPTTCASCHQSIAAEYHESMHSRAHHDKDPIYRGVRAIRAKKEGPEITAACVRCHTPRFAANPDDPKAIVGVDCASCHGLLPAASPGTLVGPNDVKPEATPAHATGPASDLFADGRKLCLVCHDQLTSPSGLPMCTTGPEHQLLAETAEDTCVSCHMPQVDGIPTDGVDRKTHASHAFLGPHRAWYQDDPTFAASAVELTAAIKGNALTVTLTSTGGHDFPTGFPGRMAVISCQELLEGDGEAWQCEPVKLGKVHVDAEGKPTLAPFAAKIASDTRLRAGKTETYRFKLPASVQRVAVTLSMRLVPPTLAEKIGLTDQPEGQPRPITTVEVTRP